MIVPAGNLGLIRPAEAFSCSAGRSCRDELVDVQLPGAESCLAAGQVELPYPLEGAIENMPPTIGQLGRNFSRHRRKVVA